MIGIFAYKANSAEQTKIWIEKFSKTKIKFVYTPTDVLDCNLLILSGGKDIGVDIERDTVELNTLDIANRKGIKIIGICI